MKNKLLVFFLLLLPFISRAQVGVQPMGAPNVINKAKGGLDEDSSLRMPGVFPTSWTWTDSCRRIWMTGGNVYFHDCSGRIQVLSMKDTAFIKSLIASGGSVMWSNITGKPAVFPPDTTIAATQSDLLQSLAPIDANLQNINNDTAKWNTAAAAITPIEANLQNINNDTAKWNSALQVETDPVFRADSGKIMHQRDTVTKYSTPTSVLGQVVAYVSSVFNGLFDGRLSTKTTDNLTEGSTNKYYTDARVQTVIGGDTTANKLSTPTSVSSQIGSAGALKVNYSDSVFKYVTPTSFTGLFNTQFATKSTTSLVEGSNLYYTDARVQTVIGSDTTTNKLSTPTSVSGQLSAYIAANFNTLFDTRLGTKTTTNLAEGSNLYYTDARVQTVVGGDTAANKLSTPTSVQSQVNTSAITKVNVADIQKTGDASNKYDINGSNPFTFHVPYTTYYQMLFGIGLDSLCRVYIVDSTNNEQTPDHNYVFKQFNYCGGCYAGWTAPTILFNDSIGHPYDEISGGQNNTGTFTIFARMRNNSNGIYTNYLSYSTNKCQTFTTLAVFPNTGFRDSQPIPHGRLIKADSGKFYQFFYGFGTEKYGQLAKSTDLINWTAAQLVFDTTVAALSETGLAYCGKDSIIALIRGIGTGTPYLMKTSIDNGNTWSPGVRLTNLGRDTLFNDVSPVLLFDTIRQRLISINTQRFINGSYSGRQADRLTFYINKPSEIWNNPTSWSYKATILRPQPNTLNMEGYPSIVQMDSTHFFGVFTEAIKYGINSSGQFVATGGESTYGYWFTMTYDSVYNSNRPVNSNGVAVYKAATNSYDWLNQPWPMPFDSITRCYMLRFQGQLAWDISGNNSMSAGSVFSTDSMGRWYVIAPGSTGQRLTMQASGYPAWQTGGTGTVTTVTCGNIGSGGNIWSSSVTNGTTTPAISFNIVNQVAHAMFGNHTGSTGSPTMAILTTGDIPVIPLSTGVSGTLPAAQFPALTGDVTTSAGAVATTIAANAVTNSKLAQMTANTIKLNNTGSTANAIDGSIAQLNTMLGFGTLQFGTSTFSGNAVATTFTVTVPSGVQAYSCVSNTPGTAIVTGANVSGTTLTITCAAAPVLGTNNVIISYTLK